MIGCPYLRLSIISLMEKVPKVSIKAILDGNIIPPQKARAASGEMLANISALD